MIIGIGNDLVNIERIEAMLEQHGEKFEDRIFTKAEQSKAHSRKGDGHNTTAASYAKRFAAKEACAKALGVGEGISWLEMEVVNEPSGKPGIVLHGKALERLKEITPPQMQARIELSLSDEYPLAQAFVVIWAA